jgi:hypothetical protein
MLAAHIRKQSEVHESRLIPAMLFILNLLMEIFTRNRVICNVEKPRIIVGRWISEGSIFSRELLKAEQ